MSRLGMGFTRPHRSVLRRRSLPALGFASLLALSAASAVSSASASKGMSSSTGSPRGGDDLERLHRLQKEITEVVKRTLPATVFIDRGSGVVISKDGLVLTNDHVVQGHKEVWLRFCLSGIKRKATVLGRVPDGDIALLKIDEKGDYPFLELGDSDKLVQGQWVLALGNPFLLGVENDFFPWSSPDFHPSVSLGVVSALHRNAPPRYPSAIQVDVAVNPGSSGGPLITLEGKVVGINGKIETKYGLTVNSGVGYAVPANQIRRFLEPLKAADGREIFPGQIFGLEVDERTERGRRGLLVKLVVQGSQADKAGFRKRDRIVAVDDQAVPTQNRFIGLLKTYPVGSRVNVRVLRDDSELEIEAVLTAAVRKPAKLGIRTESVAEGDDRLKVAELDPGSPAERHGVKVGDVILEIDGEAVKSITDLILTVRAKRAGDTIVLRILRGDRERELKVLLTPVEG